MVENVIDTKIEEVLKRFTEELAQFQNAKVKCGIIGRTGTGKSSLMNAIAGEEISVVGEIETTVERSEPYEHNGLLFYDLPGCSTQKFPREKYVDNMGIKDFDCVILVTADRFYEDDLFLITQVSKLKIPVFAVRNKIDQSVESAAKRGVSEGETLMNVYNDLNKNVENSKPSGIYLISAEYPLKYDLDKLLTDISKSLDSIKKDRFIADVHATSQKMIEQKRIVANKLVSRYAALSAANGLNPIIGLDISVDIGLLLKMGNDISNIYGLNKESRKYYETFLDLSDASKAKSILAKATQYAAKYLGREAIMILLKRFAATTATKTVSKWIPFVGQAIAAGIGFKMTSSLGTDMVDEAEAIAIELFNSVKNQH